MLQKKLPLTVLFLLLWLCPYSHATSLYYILDGSGSMWGRVDGEIKIVAAKEDIGVEDLVAAVANGFVVIPCNKKRTNLSPIGIVETHEI